MNRQQDSMERVSACLERLAPHVGREQVAITGSVASGLRSPADLDLVVAHRGVLAPSVCAEFLVGHSHDGERLLFQLVDPVSRLRIDAFFDRFGALASAGPGPFGWFAVTAHVMLAHKLELLASATVAKSVDPKHAADALALAAQVGRVVPPIDAAVLRRDVYASDLGAVCQRCAAAADPLFPLSSKARIFDILGYT